MADPTLYLFDGHNLLHASGFSDPRELRDVLASFVAMQGARVTGQPVEAATAEGIEQAFARMQRQDASAVVIAADSLSLSHARSLGTALAVVKGGARASASSTVCGTRSIRVTVTRKSGSGSFKLAVSTP